MLTGTGHTGRAYKVTDANSFTLAEYAAELSKLAKKPVVYPDLSAEALELALVGAGLPQPFSLTATSASPEASWPTHLAISLG